MKKVIGLAIFALIFSLGLVFNTSTVSAATNAELQAMINNLEAILPSKTTTSQPTKAEIEAMIVQVQAQLLANGGSILTASVNIGNTPDSKIVVAGSAMQKVGSFKFTAQNTSFTIQDLRVKTFGESNNSSVTSVTLKYKDVAGLEKTASQPLILSSAGGLATYTGLTAFIPQNTERDIDVYVDVSTIANGANSGALIIVSLDSSGGFRAFDSNGVVDTTLASQDLSSSVTSGKGTLVVRRSVPTLSSVQDYSEILMAGGNQIIGKVKISANPAGDIGWKKISFSYTKSPNTTLNTLKLYNQATNLEVSGVFSNPVTGQLIFTTTNEEQIASGSSVTYELRATVGGFGGGNNLVVVSIANPSTTGVTSSASSVETTGPVSPSFVWTDRSSSAVSGGSVHSLATLDWTNDYLVKTLPLTIGNKSYFVDGGPVIPPVTPPVTPPTTDESALIAQLQALIAQLLEQLKAQGYEIDANGNLVRVPVVPIIPPVYEGGAFCYNWTQNLSYRSGGADVRALNEALSRENISERANRIQMSIFDELTAGHVMAFQVKYSIPRTGVVGPTTRAKLNALYGCSQTENFMDFDTATRFNVVNYSGSEETFFLAVYNTAGNVVPLDTFNFPNIAVGDYSIKAMYRNTNNNHDYLTAQLGVRSGEMVVNNIRSGTKDSNGTINLANQNIEIRMSIDGKYLRIELREQNRDPQIFRMNLSQNGTSILPLLSAGIGPYFNSNPGNYVLKAYEVRASGEVSDEGTFGLTVNNDHKSFTVKEITQVQPPISDVTATVTGTPTLELIYDANQKEATLRGVFDIALTTGNSGAVLYRNFGGVSILDQNGTQSSVSARSTFVNFESNIQKHSESMLFIPANQITNLRVVSEVNPKALFAGTYRFRIVSIGAEDVAKPGSFVNIPVTPGNGRGGIDSTNSKIIVGEVSPYISSVSFVPGPVGTGQPSVFTVKGVRFDGVNLLSIDAGTPSQKTIQQARNSSGDIIIYRMEEDNKIASGRHSLTILNSVTGNSNIVWFDVGGSAQSSVTVLSPNGGEAVNVSNPLTVTFLTNNAYPVKHYINLVDETNDRAHSLDSLLGSSGLVFTQTQISQPNQSIIVSIPGSYNLNVNNRYKIEICSNNICDKSDNYFTITASSTPPVGANLSAEISREAGDQAGQWYTFKPDGTKDWVWNMYLNLKTGKKIKAISILHGRDQSNGEAWSTGSSQSLLGKLLYPLVVTTIRGGVQLNSAYDQMYSPTGSVPVYGTGFSYEFPAGSHTLKLYGNTGTTPFQGGKITVDFTDGTSVASQISASDYNPNNQVATKSLGIKHDGSTSPVSVVAGSTNAQLLSFNMITGVNDIKLNGVVVSISGVDPAQLSNLKLYADGVMIADGIGGTYTNSLRDYQFTIPQPLYIQGNRSINFAIRGGISATANGSITPTLSGILHDYGTTLSISGLGFSGNTLTIVPSTTPATYHPADTNRDGRITISEVTTYRAFAGSDTAATQVASEIWKRGEVYTFDTTSNSYKDASGNGITVTTPVNPVITSVNPQPAVIGSNVTIAGTGFSATSRVRIDGKYYNSVITSLNGGNLSFIMPSPLGSPCLAYDGQCTGVIPAGGYPVSNGAHTIAVANSNGVVSNEMSFQVGSTVTPSSITVLSPNGGEVYHAGDTVNFRWSPVGMPSNGFIKLLLMDSSGCQDFCTTYDTLVVKDTQSGVNKCLFSSTSTDNCISVNSGSVSLVLRSDIQPGRYKVRASCFMWGAQSVCPGGEFAASVDVSDSYFTITAPVAVTPVPTPVPVPAVFTPPADIIVTPAPQASTAPTTPTVAQPSLSATLSQVYEDRAGRWGGFGPGTNSGGKANDFVWNTSLTLGESKTIKAVDINHNVGGEYWSTSNTGAYPLVIFYNGSQVNTAYGQTLGTYGAGTTNLTVYGQNERAYFSGGILKVTFTDNTTVSATVPGVSTFSPAVPAQTGAALDAMYDILQSMLKQLR